MFPILRTKLQAIHSAPAEFLHKHPHAGQFFNACPSHAAARVQASATLAPRHSFPRRRETVGELDPGPLPSSSAIVPAKAGGTPVTPELSGVSRPQRRGSLRPPKARSWSPHPHFLTRPLRSRRQPRPLRRPRNQRAESGGRIWVVLLSLRRQKGDATPGRRSQPALQVVLLRGEGGWWPRDSTSSLAVLTKRCRARACFFSATFVVHFMDLENTISYIFQIQPLSPPHFTERKLRSSGV